MNIDLRPAAPAHAHHIETHQIRFCPLHETEWDHIRANSAHSRHHGSLPDPHELAHGCLAAEEDKVAHGHMSSEDDVVGESHVAADLAIVSDMGADHEQAPVAHFGDAAIILCTDIHGNAFANIAV